MLKQNSCPEVEQLSYLKENLTYTTKFSAIILGNRSKMIVRDVLYFLITFF